MVTSEIKLKEDNRKMSEKKLDKVCPHCPPNCQCGHCISRRLRRSIADWEHRTGLSHHDLVTGRIMLKDNVWVDSYTLKPVKG